mgnify:CR=1 FL=1
MKIRTIMAAAATGILLTAAGSSLAWGADWTCPRGQRTGIGYARTGTMDGHPHRTPQGMDAIAETAIMADAAAVHITDRENSTAPGSTGHMERLCGRNQM